MLTLIARLKVAKISEALKEKSPIERAISSQVFLARMATVDECHYRSIKILVDSTRILINDVLCSVYLTTYPLTLDVRLFPSVMYF